MIAGSKPISITVDTTRARCHAARTSRRNPRRGRGWGSTAVLRRRRTAMRTRRLWALAATTVVVASAGVVVGTLGGSAAARPKADVKLTWWHNATAEPGKGFWQKVADEYHAAHPNVTIDVQPIQNEQFTTKIPAALQSDSPPDLFQQWGGGQLADQVRAGKVLDITNSAKSWLGTLGGSVAGWQYKGRQYGVPYNIGIVGFWYNKALFAKAGIKAPPKTWTALLDDVGKLKTAGITPIAIGAKDRWPDAFWWDYLAVRYCSQKTLQQSAVDYKFGPACWTKAGDAVKQLLAAEPFQRGFLGTPAQQGAGSSAGLMGNGKAAMELQGHWNAGVMNSLSPDQKGIGK